MFSSRKAVGSAVSLAIFTVLLLVTVVGIPVILTQLKSKPSLIRDTSTNDFFRLEKTDCPDSTRFPKMTTSSSKNALRKATAIEMSRRLFSLSATTPSTDTAPIARSRQSNCVLHLDIHCYFQWRRSNRSVRRAHHGVRKA